MFRPAVFITVTGKTDDNVEVIPEVKQKIIREVFNNAENKDGRYIKFILGSKVMNESVTLENIRDVQDGGAVYNNNVDNLSLATSP